MLGAENKNKKNFMHSTKMLNANFLESALDCIYTKYSIICINIQVEKYFIFDGCVRSFVHMCDERAYQTRAPH